jgi:Protein of unknown function (DUF4007)
MSVAFTFAGHQTFPFRHSWLKKGINAISNDPTFFSSSRAMIELGVGKKMVESIRYWCLALRLMQEDLSSQARRGHLVPTEIGRSIFFDNGFDPYLEDPATLWLIHWLLASNLRRATIWFWMFSHLNSIEFTKERVASEIQSWLEKHNDKHISDESLKRDVDCFVRTYVNSRLSKSAIIEDSLDCPLVELGLITELNDGKTYQFQRGPQETLPDEILAFALMGFWSAIDIHGKTLAFAKIAHAPGSPGRIFKLDEDSLASRLERIEAMTGGALYYDETSALKQMYKRREVQSMDLLAKYYQSDSISVVLSK